MNDTETPRIVRAANALQRLNSDTYIRRKFPQQLQDVAATINDMTHVGRVGNQRWRVGMTTVTVALRLDTAKVRAVVNPNGSITLYEIDGHGEVSTWNTSAVPPPAAPKLNILCETRSNGIIGSTSLNVVRVNTEDDGSFTAVTDYWPPAAQVQAAPQEAVRQAANAIFAEGWYQACDWLERDDLKFDVDSPAFAADRAARLAALLTLLENNSDH